MYKVVVVEPMKVPYVKEIGEELIDLQTEVNGLIEMVYAFDTNDIALICNEEGKLLQLPLNRPLFYADNKLYDIVAGTFFVVGVAGDNFRSLTDDEVNKATEFFQKTYTFEDMKKLFYDNMSKAK